MVLLGVFCLALLPACSHESDADKIKDVIADMAAGAEAKDISRVKKHIAKEYKDPAGNDYDALKGIMLFYFMQQDSINVFLRRQEVEVNSGRGHAAVRAVISRGKKLGSVKDIVPEEAGGFVFDFTFDRRGGDWLLISATWRQVNVTEAL